MNLKPIVQAGILTSFAVTLSGCGISWFAHRDTNPTIQDVFTRPLFDTSGRVVNTFATTASRRVVIVSEDISREKKFQFLVCAEPPPDVGEAFASSIFNELKLAAKEPQSGITAELSDQYARAASTHIAPLLYRTQGLQFYRDGLHSLCIDMMNGWLDGNEKGSNPPTSTYQAAKKHLIHEAALLILQELPIMERTQIEFYKNARAGIGLEDMKKMADIVKPVPATTTTSTANSTTTTTVPNPSGSTNAPTK